ncbi:MAG: thermonuclease family protein, partial [Candidatus Omnitrophota bacterium]
NGDKVRYLGIDTPELHHPHKVIIPGYLAKEAQQFNEKLVSGKKVRLEFDSRKKDKYGRLLAYVYVGDVFVNARMIEEGYARLLIIPPNVKYADEFLKLQEKARSEKRGIWSK